MSKSFLIPRFFSLFTLRATPPHCYKRPIWTYYRTMSGLTVDLTAPNGVKYTQPTGLFIGGEWVAAKSGEKITSISPINESEIASVEAAGPDDVDLAVAAARKAFKDPSWSDIGGTERGELMFKLAALIEKHREVLATIETWDNGRD